MARITIDNLRHAYISYPTREEHYALKRVDLAWADGGAYALLGPSGCGKTTLLNLISGLLHPSEGKILFDGADVTSFSPEKRNIAQVFQFPVIYDTMTVRDNLAFPLRNRNVPEAEIAKRVADIADMLELTAMLDKRASGLTADGKQKISLGRGLVRSDVNVIMFDEPLTVIDPHLKWQLRSKLKELQQKIRRTMIYVTHDQTEALTFCGQFASAVECAQAIDCGQDCIIGAERVEAKCPEHNFAKFAQRFVPHDQFVKFTAAIGPDNRFRGRHAGIHNIPSHGGSDYGSEVDTSFLAVNKSCKLTKTTLGPGIWIVQPTLPSEKPWIKWRRRAKMQISPGRRPMRLAAASWP